MQSNQKYVSHVINDGLKKNLRSFFNGYRIYKAKRLFPDPDDSKYTIEFVATLSRLKAQNSFREAFKEATGVNPSFYPKSMRRV